MTYQTEIKIHFDEGDPAGIAFSGVLFQKMHRCYEDFIALWDESAYFMDETYAYPLRHISTEFMGPLQILKKYPVRIWIGELGEHHFKVCYEVGPQAQPLAKLQSVHVCCSKNPFKKAPLPKALADHLKTYLIPE